MNKKQKIVTIGGGSGQYVLLSGLRDLPNLDITAVVSMFDSGGGTGRLRDELGVLPPGDILKCLLALSNKREVMRGILRQRFVKHDKLKGHNAGNMLLTMLAQYTGSFTAGIEALGEILEIKGRVLPVTIDKATLVAELIDGSHLYGETTIDVPKDNQREKIKKIFLVPHHNDSIKAYPPVIEAIKEADYIIIGPGDMYSSIAPNFLVSGMKEAIVETKAKILYIVNIMTKYGETDDFSGEDFIFKIEDLINKKVDVIILNSAQPDSELMAKYEEQKAHLVKIIDYSLLGGRTVIKGDLLNAEGDIARHDSLKLANLINKILQQ